MSRKSTRGVMVGSVQVGGGAPISVQSMTKTQTRDVTATVRQIRDLERVGCDIIRIAVPDRESAQCVEHIKKSISIPLVADIHFDPDLAVLAIERGADKIRINPGTIPRKRLEDVISCASEYGVPIRIGINAGSVERSIREKHGGPTASALVESALLAVHFFVDRGFEDLVISVKSTDIRTMVKAYRTLSERTDYALHLGVTEAGMPPEGIVRSSMGLGILLADGIGDTIRVSLTAAPEEEVLVGQEVLKGLSLRDGLMLYSCPTCARCEIDLASIVKEVRKRLRGVEKPLRIAVMGCVVNGPGEAREADVGIAGGKGGGLLFRKGVVVRRVPAEEIVDELLKELEEI